METTKYQTKNTWVFDENVIKMAMSKMGSCINGSGYFYSDPKLFNAYFYISLYPNGKEEEQQNEFWIYIHHHIRYDQEMKLRMEVGTPSGYDKEFEGTFGESGSQGFLFATHEELLDPELQLFEDGKLSLRFNTIASCLNGEAEAAQKNQMNFLSQQLFFSNNKDLKIVVDGQEILVHKCIIETFSPLFKAMTAVAENDGQIEISGFDFETVQSAMNFCYGGFDIESLETDQLLSLFKFADKYQMQNLAKEVPYELRKQINPENICIIANQVFECNDKDLQKICVDRLVTYIKDEQNIDDIAGLNPKIKTKVFDLLPLPLCYCDDGKAVKKTETDLAICFEIFVFMFFVFMIACCFKFL